MSSYYTFKEALTKDNFTNFNTVDNFPFYNKWRDNPLSDIPTIRANVAGYYPYKSQLKEMPVIKNVEVEAIFPSALMFPKDYPINYGNFIKIKGPDLIKGNMVNIEP